MNTKHKTVPGIAVIENQLEEDLKYASMLIENNSATIVVVAVDNRPVYLVFSDSLMPVMEPFGWDMPCNECRVRTMPVDMSLIEVLRKVDSVFGDHQMLARKEAGGAA